MPAKSVKLTGEYNGRSQENQMKFEKYELESGKRFKIEIPTANCLYFFIFTLSTCQPRETFSSSLTKRHKRC
ncbi:hypothetical protein HMI54_010344 [Coelomomyces lativittatus]|nr:hypothetical protein HMI54_010344 [Coelomomyces lativittatus]